MAHQSSKVSTLLKSPSTIHESTIGNTSTIYPQNQTLSEAIVNTHQSIRNLQGYPHSSACYQSAMTSHTRKPARSHRNTYTTTAQMVTKGWLPKGVSHPPNVSHTTEYEQMQVCVPAQATHPQVYLHDSSTPCKDAASEVHLH